MRDLNLIPLSQPLTSKFCGNVLDLPELSNDDIHLKTNLAAAKAAAVNYDGVAVEDLIELAQNRCTYLRFAFKVNDKWSAIAVLRGLRGLR